MGRAKEQHRQPVGAALVSLSDRRRRWWLGLLLVAMAVAAYMPVWSAGFIWDDPDYVTHNATLRTWRGLADIWFSPTATPQYYPLVHTSFWIEYHLWELSPLGYHLDNVLLHALNAILLWVVLRRLRVPGAWLAGAIFAVHPVMVESVAWVTERKNVLSLAFYLLAMLCALRFLRVDDSDRDKRDKQAGVKRADYRWYVGAMVFFVAALLSKTVTASFPAAVLLIIYYVRGRVMWRNVAPWVPFFVLGAASGLITGWLEAKHVGAWGPEWNFTLVDRVLIAGRAVWFYLYKLVLPVRLSFIYPRWQINAQVWWQYIFPVAAVLLIVVLFLLRRQIGRGPLVAVLFFGGTLVPALGFVNTFPMRYSFVADHFQYHASIGMIALIAASLVWIFRKFRLGHFVPGGLVVLTSVLGSLTFAQARNYRDPLTLWDATLAHNPDSWMVHVNIAQELLGKWREAGSQDQPPVLAGTHLHRALELAPDISDPHFSMGMYASDRRDWPAAIEQFRRAIEIAEAAGQPYYYPNYYDSLGHALYMSGDVEGAIGQYRRAVTLMPSYARAHFNLALAYEKQQRPDEALQQYADAVRVAPDYAEARYNYGNLLRTTGQFAQAVEQYQILLSQQPNRADAHVNMAATLLQMGQISDAVAHYAQAARLDPSLRPAIEQSLRRLNLRLPR